MRHIKSFESIHDEIDPFGEETWENPTPKFEIGEMVRANCNHFRLSYNERIYNKVYYFITNINIIAEATVTVSVMEVSSGKKVDGWFNQDSFDKLD